MTLKSIYTDKPVMLKTLLPSKTTIAQALKILKPELKTKEIMLMINMDIPFMIQSYPARMIQKCNLVKFYNNTELCRDLSLRFATVILSRKYKTFEDCLKSAFGLI